MSTAGIILILVISLTGVASAAPYGGHRVGGYAPIEDIKDPNLVEIAKFAVKEHNKQAGTQLEYVNIIKGEQQVVSGMNYKLVISATDGSSGGSRTYQAVVYDVAWKKTRTLISFTPL